MKNIHYQALAVRGMEWLIPSPSLSLSRSIYPSVCFPLSHPFSLPFLHFPSFWFRLFLPFSRVLHSCELRHSPFISFTKAVKFLSLSASAASPQPKVVKWNERNVQTLTGFHLHAVFSQFYNNWEPDCCCTVDYLRHRATVRSQRTRGSRTPVFK